MTKLLELKINSRSAITDVTYLGDNNKDRNFIKKGKVYEIQLNRIEISDFVRIQRIQINLKQLIEWKFY